MNQSTKRILFSVMAVILLLTACAPAAAPAATQDPALVQQLIEQSVALTVAAQNAQTLEAQALIPAATNTPLPTQTEAAQLAPSLPTATPFVIVPPTNTLAPVTGGGGSTTVIKPEYACDVIETSPADNSTWKKKKEFDINWTLVNTGTKTWRAGLDFKYFSGPEMTTVKVIELPALKPGEKYKVVLDAAAPDQAGFQVMTWSVEGNFCYPYIAINVE